MAATENTSSFVHVTGSLCCAALLSSLTAGLVAGSRLAPVAGSLPISVLAAAAALVMPAMVITVLLRLAAAGLGGEEGPRVRTTALALALTGAFVVPTTALFGRILRASTHHTGLGGVTFAVGAIVLLLAALPLAFRVATLTRGWSAGAQAGVLAVVTAALIAAVALAVLRAQAAQTAGELPMAATVAVDAAILVVSGLVAALMPWTRSRLAVVIGLPALLLVVLVGSGLLHSRPELSAALNEQLPLGARLSAGVVPTR